MYAIALTAGQAPARNPGASSEEISEAISLIKNFEALEGDLEHSYTSLAPHGFDAVLFFNSIDSGEALRQARSICQVILAALAGSENSWRFHVNLQEVRPATTG